MHLCIPYSPKSSAKFYCLLPVIILSYYVLCCVHPFTCKSFVNHFLARPVLVCVVLCCFRLFYLAPCSFKEMFHFTVWNIAERAMNNAHFVKSFKQKPALTLMSTWIKITPGQLEHWIYRSVDRIHQRVLLCKNKQKTSCKESTGAPSDPGF